MSRMKRDRGHRGRAWPGHLVCGLAAAAMLLSGARESTAALTGPSCLAKKLKEWGKLRKCQATENGKALQANPADPAKCQAKFTSKIAALSTAATTTAVACRYQVNGDGTVTDYDTGLMWEQKTDDDSVHDRDVQYTWSAGGDDFAAPDGTAFTVLLASLNDCASADGSTVTGGLAGHCDWRLPSKLELQTIVDAGVLGCGTGSAACIDETVFGPTIADYHWSGTRDVDPENAWFVTFYEEGANLQHKSYGYAVRAVRSAL